MDKEMFRYIYVTYVRSKLEYAAPIWDPHLRKHKARSLTPAWYKTHLRLQPVRGQLDYRRGRSTLVPYYPDKHLDLRR
ncbi:hypothetical protein SK128_006364 [Halocaridina rubra]|uniref:Uncharacterized protein n=1 Tax=Halocaridina rubra TaxID=373956 RepID=A0AAN9A048_HALRR